LDNWRVSHPLSFFRMNLLQPVFTANMDGSRRLSITGHHLHHMLTVHAMCEYV
jgi:hypothetical protein